MVIVIHGLDRSLDLRVALGAELLLDPGMVRAHVVEAVELVADLRIDQAQPGREVRPRDDDVLGLRVEQELERRSREQTGGSDPFVGGDYAGTR